MSGLPVLYIGNRNYSSWSLRAWLLPRGLDIAFEEQMLTLFTRGFGEALATVTPAGRVPVLVDDGFAVWDSLAICEYVAERYPEQTVWPRDARMRARARSLCAEMHAGFTALRSAMPMNLAARFPPALWPVLVQRDITRIVEIWEDLRAEHAAAGPFLCGAFGAIDAFFAPVATRLQTYSVTVPGASADWIDTIRTMPAMHEWAEAALAEHRFLPEDEPYRTSRT
jgi:glutathione S-transferase